jgi:hypothetical protein
MFNLSKNSWININDTYQTINDKIKITRYSDDDKTKILNELNVDKYKGLEKEPGKIPDVFDYYYNKIINIDINENEYNSVESLYKIFKEIQNKINISDNILYKIKNIDVKTDNIFDNDNENNNYSFINPLNYFIEDWNYSGKLISDDIYKTTYKYISDKYLDNTSNDERKMLGCEINPFGRTDTNKYSCDNLKIYMESFGSLRNIDLTIPYITPLFTTDRKCLSGFINDVFNNTFVNIKQYFPYVDIDGTLNPDTKLDKIYNYIPLDTFELKVGEINKSNIKSETIKLFDDDITGTTNNKKCNIPGNLFKLFTDDKEKTSSKIKEQIDKLYNTSSSLNDTELKFREAGQDISIKDIKNNILILYSIYTKSGLDYYITHKKYGNVEEINRKIAKELLYLGLFTFYNYLEHNIFKKVIEIILKNNISTNEKNNIQKYFDNILLLLRTNTVILFGYDKTSINLKNNYGILRGQSKTIISDKTNTKKLHLYFRLENGYENSKLDEGDDLENFKKRFPFNIKNSNNHKEIIVSVEDTATNKNAYFIYNEKLTGTPLIPVKIENLKYLSDNNQDFNINNDIYLVYDYNNTGNKPDENNQLVSNLLTNIKNEESNVLFINKNTSPITNPTSNIQEGTYSLIDIASIDFRKYSYMIYNDDYEIKNKTILDFMTGNENSVKDLMNNKSICFGFFQYKRNINEKIFDIYEQYCMNVLSHIDKLIIYIKIIFKKMENGVNIKIIKDWYNENRNDFNEIINITNTNEKKNKFEKVAQKLIKKYKQFITNIIKYIKDIINYEYNTYILKKSSTTNYNELLILLRISRNKLFLYRKIINYSYLFVTKEFARAHDINIEIVKTRNLPEKYIEYLNKIFDNIIQETISILKEDSDTRIKSLKLGIHKEFVSFFKKIVDPGFNLEMYNDKDETLSKLDNSEFLDKLFELDINRNKEKSICNLSNIIYSIPTLIKSYTILNSKYNLKLYTSSSAFDLWNKILYYLNEKNNIKNIMIPFSTGLLGDYGLLNVKKFLSYTTNFSDCIEKDLSKSALNNLDSVILVNFDSKDIKDKRTWTTINKKHLKQKVIDTNIYAKYHYMFELLFNPHFYKENVSRLWTGGMLLNNISIKKHEKNITSFLCLSTRLNQLTESYIQSSN